jgi:hypothetical protein
VTDVPQLARPQFFDGQALTAADLTAVTDYHRQMLWLHQRTLHGWGIAAGLVVTGSKGAKTVSVAPGYAIDQQGQSIVLTAPVELPVPAVVGGPSGTPVSYYLTATYQPDDQLAAAVRAGSCGTNGAIRRDEQPLIRWQEPAAITLGIDIVLAQIAVQTCALAADVSTAPRRNAIPDRQPYVYAGQTGPAGNDWQLWRVDGADRPVGYTVPVNTTEAGFANTPRYHVQVVGSRVVPASLHLHDGDAVLDGYAQVSADSSAGFVLQMTLPAGSDRSGPVNPPDLLTADVLAKIPTALGWYVSWVGVEG